MSNKTTVITKVGVVKAVVNNLKSRGINEKQRLLLESVQDVDKAYVIANRYARNYIHFGNIDKKNEFLDEATKLSNKWVANGNKWLSEDGEVVVVKVTDEEVADAITPPKEITEYESNEEYSSKIKSIDNVVSEKVSKATNGIRLISSALERGVKKFKKEFLDSFGIKAKLIGEGDDIKLYYCDNVNGVFEIA